MRKYVAIGLCLFMLGCSKTAKVIAPSDIDEPDRDLYEKAMKDMDRHNYTLARLNLQTLIGAYLDSDYFQRAKYAIAESYYREGGRENLDSAEAAYKDYIIYFRDSDLADDAQLMVAMTHVRRVQSPDRDNTEARLAELELKEMIASYPNSEHLEEAKKKLREVDEVLAEGNLRIANQYFLRKQYKASIGRYLENEDKYPDYTQMDLNLFYHAESLRLLPPPPDVHPNPNLEASGRYYAEVVSNYPMSIKAKQAIQRLMELMMPVPPPNPVAVAHAPQEVDKGGFFNKTIGVFKGHPTVPTDTGAASVRDGEKNKIDPKAKKD